MSDELVHLSGERPAWLAGREKAGIDQSLLRAVVMPRMKIVQKTASQQLLAAHAPGEIINGSTGEVFRKPTMVGNKAAWDATPPLLVTPVLFWREFLVMNSLGLQPVVLDRSFDEASEIARIATSQERTRPHPNKDPKKVIKFCDAYNFIFFLHDPQEAKGSVCLATFISTAVMPARRLASLIVGRNAPIYAGVYAMSVEQRSNDDGEWWSPVFRNAGWVSEELGNQLAEKHSELFAQQDAVRSANASEGAFEEANTNVSTTF